MRAARGALTWLALALSPITVAPAGACEPPESPAAYVINHETHGDIGTHVLNFRCDGDQLIVETEVDVKVKILFVTAYERKAHYREVWQDDRLISYEARTDDNGDLYETTARIDGDKMIVDGIEDAVGVPLDTVSSHPWNVKAIDRPVIFGQRDGRIRKVRVEEAGWETLKIDNRPVDAQKFVVRGDLERELFYDADGTWLQWRLERDGKTVTITKRGLDR
ncbi:MAG: DUF6134 family protein [Pseudomonadota bacterium]